MKKLVLAMVFAASIFSGTTLTTQAEERLDIADIVYPSADKTEYYSLKLLTYASNFKKFEKGANNFAHIRLTNNQTYKLVDYASSYLAASREGSTKVLERGLNKLVSGKTPQPLNIVQGKFSNGKVVVDPAATPRTFEVIDIK